MWGYVIGMIIWSIIWGCAARAIVVNKGYDDESTKYFWLGFFFAFIAVIVAACRPQYQRGDYSQSQLSLLSREAEEHKILSNGGWKCDCGRLNYNYCTSCACGRNKWEVLAKRQEAEEKAKVVVVKNNEPDKSAAQQIKEFKELYDSGIISSEEFETKKKQLLGL